MATTRTTRRAASGTPCHVHRAEYRSNRIASNESRQSNFDGRTESNRRFRLQAFEPGTLRAQARQQNMP
eukprot:12946552-Alexandrium_andersonii.AAC.1